MNPQKILTKPFILGSSLVVLTLGLAGCGSSSGPHGGHSEKWYEAHVAQSIKEFHWCQGQSISSQEHSKSCVRAAHGLAEAALKSPNTAEAQKIENAMMK